jgi:hypothetical protein
MSTFEDIEQTFAVTELAASHEDNQSMDRLIESLNSPTQFIHFTVNGEWHCSAVVPGDVDGTATISKVKRMFSDVRMISFQADPRGVLV